MKYNVLNYYIVEDALQVIAHAWEFRSFGNGRDCKNSYLYFGCSNYKMPNMEYFSMPYSWYNVWEMDAKDLDAIMYIIKQEMVRKLANRLYKLSGFHIHNGL